ncbi:MAG: hypothetical protein IIA41_02265, partial [SAR324 cluster bacterium]|nr:hypothetical protein [SAR324 cluster bacterium]
MIPAVQRAQDQPFSDDADAHHRQQAQQQAVLLGDADVVVAGGMENMSASPFLLPKGRYGYKMGDGEIIDHMVRDGLWCALSDCHMGVTAENVAGDYEISRADQDEFSANSQQKTAQAWEAGRFADEIVPVEVKKRKETITVDKDEHFRAGTTAEVLGKLRPAFQPDGSVTAGNASGINDGAAAVVVMARKKAEELGNRKCLSEALTFPIPFYHLSKGDMGSAREAAEEGMNMAAQIGASASESGGAFLVGQVAWMQGEYERAIECQERAFEAGQASGLPFWQVGPLCALGTIYQDISMELASQTMEYHTQALELMDMPLGTAMGAMNWAEVGFSALAKGDLERASEFFNKGLTNST